MKILSGVTVGFLYICMKVLQQQTKTMKCEMENYSFLFVWRANKLHHGIDETPSPRFITSLICQQLTGGSVGSFD